MIEIERRVLLTNQKYSELKNFLDSKAILKKDFKRFTIVNVGNANFKPETEREIDLRVRTTGTSGKFTVKHGNWHKDISREEYELTFQTNEIKELMNILLLQKYIYYITTYIHRFHYTYKDFEITLDKYSSMDANLLEVEISVDDDNKESTASNDSPEELIDKFLSENDLIPLSSQGTIDFITKVNNVEEMRVDFTKINVNEWYKKWEEYIFCRY